jgi:DNA-binding response OmpR family regulator
VTTSVVEKAIEIATTDSSNFVKWWVIKMVKIHTKPRKKILIVDDDDDTVYLIKSLLELYSYDIIEASTGKGGLLRAQKHHPDLIILDVMLPEMHGFSVCRIIKNDENLNHIKILILSAKLFDADKRKALDSGADAYMAKPFDPSELLAKVKELLSL